MREKRKDPNGMVLRTGESMKKGRNLYVYSYTDPLGRRRCVYAKTLLELREKEKRLMKDQLDGLDIYASGKATLNQTFDRYIASKHSLKPQTKATYKYTYKRYVEDTFGKKLIAQIKYSDVKFFYNHLLYERELSVSTVDNVHTVLHPTFDMAARDGIIRSNPSDKVMREIKQSMGKNKGIRHALTIEEQHAFLNYIETSVQYRHWLPLFTVLFGTGMRIGELIGLRWDDLDFDERMISVNHAVIYRWMESGKMELHVSSPKTESGTRTIPMMDKVYDAFMEERRMQEFTGIFNTEVVDDMDGFIFCNMNGNVHKPNVINAAIRRIYEAYNEKELINASRENRKPVIIPHFSCHHIRHTFCTRLCENEINLKAIQAIMGHADIETTMNIYAEATQALKKEAVQELENRANMF